MILNIKDLSMNNYVTWVYSTLLQRLQAAETDISANGGDITRIYGHVGYDGQLAYGLDLASVQIPENSDLDDYKTVGTYYCTGTSIATTIANSPTTYNYKLVVEVITAAFIQQTVIDRAGRRWHRSYTISTDTWGSWLCGSLNNITNLTINNNGELVVTRADGITATFAPTSLI